MPFLGAIALGTLILWTGTAPEDGALRDGSDLTRIDSATTLADQYGDRRSALRLTSRLAISDAFIRPPLAA